MAMVDEIREDLERLLGRAEGWLDGLATTSDLVPETAETAADVSRVRSLRTRALSSLLNVGLLGRQSSGKSFLISGLQAGLDYVRVADAEGGVSDKYIGILPSSPTPTTACPSTVVPVAQGSVEAFGRGLLRVRFVDSADPGWVEIGTDLPPSVVAAYGAADGDVTDRKRAHINLRVAEIEVLIPQAVLPAKFFDLPGAEAPDETHEEIMRRAWAEADCFLYVSQATATLTSTELGLIRDLYNHHLQTGKRVLWVLTGIDRANQLGNDNRPAWRATLETNNAYLRERFGHTTSAPETFIGEGFVAVSPAWEAQAAFDEAEGSVISARRNRDASRMSMLRDRLTELIGSGAGYRHLAQIAEESRLLLRRRQRPLADMLAAHQVSVEELEVQRSGVRGRLERTEDSATRIRAQLNEDLDRRVRAAGQPFGELAEVLHRGLDDLIDSGDLGLEHINEIDVRQARLFTEWMTALQGPATIWQRNLEELDGKGRALLRLELGEEGIGSQLVAPEPLDTHGLLGPAPERRSPDIYGLVQAAAAAVSVVGPVAGGVTWLMTSLTLATLAFPVGAAIAVGVTISMGAKALRERESVIQSARTERKRRMDQQVGTARADFATVARLQGRLLGDAVDTHIEQHRVRLQSTLQQIEARIDSPDMALSRELVARLAPVDRAGREVIDDLHDLVERTRG
jgi:hypothetical protein